MIFAYFVSCIMNTVTGATDCGVSYTEMSQVIAKGTTCTSAAVLLQEDAMNLRLMENIRTVPVLQITECGDEPYVRAKALDAHKALMRVGFQSEFFRF